MMARSRGWAIIALGLMSSLVLGSRAEARHTPPRAAFANLLVQNASPSFGYNPRFLRAVERQANAFERLIYLQELAISRAITRLQQQAPYLSVFRPSLYSFRVAQISSIANRIPLEIQRLNSLVATEASIAPGLANTHTARDQQLISTALSLFVQVQALERSAASPSAPRG